MGEYFLELQGVTKHFGGIKALTDVHLQVKPGEVHALLGENGAGKSTLMKVLSGVYRGDSGTIRIEGQVVQIDNPKHAQDLGIGIIYQEFSLVPYLSVAENIYLGREVTGATGMLSKKEMKTLSAKHLNELGITINPDEKVTNLSIAEQQFVEITKALSQDVRVLILDEPSATLTPTEVERLFKLMRDLKQKGVAMIFISHHLDEIFDIADRVTVLRDGLYVDTRQVSDCTENDLVQMMVGREINYEYPKRSPEAVLGEEVALNVKCLKRGSGFPKNNFQVRRGEILGVAGLVGAGRTELFRALIGVDSADIRDVEIHETPLTIKNPTDSLQAGIGLLPEDRKSQGLILPFSVERNVTLTTLRKLLTKRGTINTKAAKQLVEKQVRDINVKTPDIWQEVGNLSGGNQQKVVIAKWLSSHCNILIFDEPTRGIDVGAKTEIYHLMRAFTEEGMTVIMISSELPEVVGMSDRVLVMRNHSIVAELQGDDINPQKIMMYAAGAQA